ncbi:MAG: hypothetical protein EOO13_05680 [Chitinophagaceae bacterium]|nr:MAG: hypothetical protein EOO13_05680 [Chitinophagaceae bacterium]
MEEVKSMDATPQRPEGSRIIDAALTEVDLNQLISDLKEESTWKESDRNSITVHKSDNFVIVLMGLHDGAELKPHNAAGVLSLQVIKGKIDFIVEAKKVEMETGNMVVLHDRVFHSVVAKEDSFLLLSIAKVKEEK